MVIGNVIHRNRNALTSLNTKHKRPSVVINKHPERQTNFSRLPIVSGAKLFREASLPLKGQKSILIFTDSIPKGICNRELNSFIRNGKTKMLSFPRATSKEYCRYLHVHVILPYCMPE